MILENSMENRFLWKISIMKCCRDEVSQEKIRILGLVIKRSPLILRRTVSIESVLESDK